MSDVTSPEPKPATPAPRARWEPSYLAFGAAAVLGLFAIVSAILLARHGMPFLLVLAITTGGLLKVVLAARGFSGSRAAWAFLTALVGVSGVLTLFGSTKIAHAVGIKLGFALFLPAIYAVVVVLLADNDGAPN